MRFQRFMKFLLELTGDAPDIAVEEVRSLCLAYGKSFSMIERDDRVLVFDTDAPIEALKKRLALTWSIKSFHLSCAIGEAVSAVADIELAAKTFRVSVRRLGGVLEPEDTVRLTRDAGATLSGKYIVDLDNAEAEVRIYLGQRCHVGVLIQDIERSGFEERKSEVRPFSKPISLHPKFTRALVNLTGVKENQTLLDPFCGTGGILLEAGLMGMNIAGSDIDDEMIAGTGENLEHFGVDIFHLMLCDISKIKSHFGQVDAIATDPPYGRSASTAKESIEALYKRSFKSFAEVLKPGGRLAIVLPSKKHVKLGTNHFTLLAECPVRVHKSLTRHFCVFRK
jgi:tRNA (guanine10-N2)-dimethyltransferase